MSHQDELQLLLAPGPAAGSAASAATGADPLATMLQRLAALPAQTRPTPSPLLAAWLDDPQDPRDRAASLELPSGRWTAVPGPSVAATPVRRRVHLRPRLRPRTAAGWLVSLGLGTGGLLLVGTAAVAAIGHVTGSPEPPPLHPHVIVTRQPGQQSTPGHESTPGQDTHGTKTDTHPNSGTPGHPNAPTPALPVPVPPAPAPPPAPRDGSPSAGGGSHDGGSGAAPSGGG